MRVLCVTILYGISILFISAQPYQLSFHNITSADGLPFENHYFSIVQDYKGFIWFASDNGLHKYDGYDFFSYYNNPNDSTSIKGRSIRCLLEDSNHNLWIGSIGGLNIYNRKMDNFIHVPVLSNNNLRFNFDTRSIIETPDKQILVGLSYLGICTFNPEYNRLEIVQFNIPGLSNDFLDDINNIIIDNDNFLWFSTDLHGLLRLDRKAKDFIHFSPESEHFLSSVTTYSFILDKKGFLWIATDNGLNKIDTKNLTTKVYYAENGNEKSISYDIIWRPYEDRVGNLWVCTDGGGLDLYKRETDEFIHFVHDKESDITLAGNKLNGIFVDNQYNIFVNTVGHGLCVANLKESESFKTYLHSTIPDKSLGYNIINAFVEDDKGNIWIGTDGGGLDYFDRKTNTFKHYKADESNPNELQTNTIVSLYISKKGELWVGTYKGGLSKFNKSNQTFKTYFHDPLDSNSLSNNDIRGIIEDENGNLILATCGGGISVFNIKTEKFTNYNENTKKPNKLCNIYCQSINRDSDGYIWIGTYYGLSRWDKNNNQFINFYYDHDDSTTINDFTIYSIFEDKNKNLWFGTVSGLNAYNKETQTFKPIKESNFTVFGIQEDDSGNLWLATEKGLKKYNTKTKQIENHSSNYGLQGQSFRPGATLKTKDGEMIFGGNRGFITFYPDSIKRISYRPPVYITDILVPESKSTSEYKHFSHINKEYNNSEIILTYKQSFIRIKYTALDFYNSDHVRYAYKLEGFDKDWHYVEKQRIATYSNLDPGKYIFIVKASNKNENWQSDAVLKITILPPWWDTILAKSLFLIIIVVAISTTYFYRINSLKRQKLLLDKLVIKRTQEIEKINKELLQSNQTKDKLFSIIAHDLKNPFSNVLGFSELLYTRYHRLSEEKKLLQIKLLHQSAERIYNLLENLLDWSRSQSGRLKYRPELLSLKEIIESNIELLGSLIKDKGLNVIVEIPEGIKIYADRNMINTVVRNLLSNAAKFSNQGNISIHAKRDNSNIIFKIKDEGVGIPEEQLKNIFDIESKISTPGTDGETGSGLGLIICKEFIERNNGSISIKSKINKGSEFTIKIPTHS